MTIARKDQCLCRYGCDEIYARCLRAVSVVPEMPRMAGDGLHPLGGRLR